MVNSQKYRALRFICSITIVVFMFWGCNPTRHIPADKYLLNTSRIQIDNKKINLQELESNIRQKANKRILGLRFHLWLYNISNIKKETGIHKFLRKTGEEPVIWDPVATAQSVNLLRRYLDRRGYYNAMIFDTIIFKKQKANVLYKIRTNAPYTIRNIKYAIEDTAIQRIVLPDTINSLFKRGQIYDQDILGTERIRIEYWLRDRGYYNFTRYFIYYDADTSLNRKQVDLVLNIQNNEIKQPNGQSIFAPHKIYKIKQVTIRTEPDKTLLTKDLSSELRQDTVNKFGIRFIYQNNNWVKPNIIQQSNFIAPDNIFRISDVENTKKHLSSLGVFRTVNTNQFTELPSNDSSQFNYLNAEIHLSPLDIQSYTWELEGTNSSGNFGGALSLIYEHRSLFGNAENLNLRLKGALESVSKSGIIYKAVEYGTEATVKIPKFLIPFNSMGFKKKYNPQTNITFAYNYKKSPDLTSTVANASFGYSWKGNRYLTHIVNPLDLSLVNIQSISDYLKGRIANTYLVNSYIDHVVSATSYSLVFNNQNLKKAGNYQYLRWNLESSGNLLTLYNKLFSPSKSDTSYYTLFKIRYSQFAKTDVDCRLYTVINNDNSLVYRFFAGVAYPYGNARSIPFEKQYFSGGANSVRGWPVRTLGPGSFRDTIYSQGDIKLEANIEYRFKLISVLEGALFTDVGNVWAIFKDSHRPGAEFLLDKFYKDLAVGSGLGLRLNFGFALLRFDLGAKVYNPMRRYNRWIFNNGGLTMNNLALSMAIGYPF
ncbi:MAG: BamA/TamA family outer membrane protein [Bacteroidota bacterium]|nr:BamA/TamA family outer membrane protein [Bacteroidota bacterium]